MTKEVVHKSKIGLEIIIPLVLILGTVMAIMVVNSVWVGLAICGLITLFIAHIFTSTYYKITTDNKLFIRCGFLESFDINIDDIEWIKKTMS